MVLTHHRSEAVDLLQSHSACVSTSWLAGGSKYAGVKRALCERAGVAHNRSSVFFWSLDFLTMEAVQVWAPDVYCR